jgi:uncharacterized protein (DUF2236 family)
VGHFLFEPDSMMWRINREAVLLVGGRATLLMQLAHPLVAAGVDQHSRFTADPLGRLRRTMNAVHDIVFGHERSARERAEAINAIHDRVRGTSSDGRPYFGRDPYLLLWVYSTLVEGSLRVYEAFVGRLSADESSRYYDETKLVGVMFGIPEEVIPRSLADLRGWMDERVERREVVVTPTARSLARPLLRPVPVVPRQVVKLTALLAAGLLPPAIRSGYGLSAGPLPDLALAAAGRTFRSARPFIPDALITFPSARRALRTVEAPT